MGLLQQQKHHPVVFLLLLLLAGTTGLSAPPRSFGSKEYWRQQYLDDGNGEQDPEQKAWYAGWRELEPFFRELVPQTQRVLVIGCGKFSVGLLIQSVGNDPTVAGMYDAGWKRLSACDYLEEAVERAARLYAGRSVDLFVADARDMTVIPDASFDVVLDKGTLDAIFLIDSADLPRALKECARVLRPGGRLVAISNAASEQLLAATVSSWSCIRDGSLYIAACGCASSDLSANLLAWEKKQESPGA